MQKYVSTRILSGFHKAAVNMRIVKVKVHLLPGPTLFLSGIWIEILKYENMFLPQSYLFSIRQLASCEFLNWKLICYTALPGSYLAYVIRN